VKGEDLKDFYEILRQKETDYAQLRKEVEALRIAAPLLDPEGAMSEAANTTETLDEMITRERSLSESATSLESATQSPAAEDSPSTERNPDGERKGPSSENVGETSWWRRLSGT
jgi:hypothetical protein